MGLLPPAVPAPLVRNFFLRLSGFSSIGDGFSLISYPDGNSSFIQTLSIWFWVVSSVLDFCIVGLDDEF
jgi:hypothetical protein